ncbi:MAG: O-methyltransferase family 3 [Firmicutes bacterium]|nr:O-methyltransferase family 3 [Bacillota bacterium]
MEVHRPAAGRLCYMIARMTGARRIFELGSGFGYSTLWFARAVAENGGGEVYHTVWDEALSREAQGYIERAGLSHIVRFRVSEATAALRDLPGPFDLIFNDIDKHGYPASLPLIKERLRQGGVLIVDNMLWSGRIFDAQQQDRNTEGIREATRMLFEDRDWSASLLPVRDGLVLALRR